MKDLDEDDHLFKQITSMILWHEITWGETVTSRVKLRVILFWVEHHFKSLDYQHCILTETLQLTGSVPCISFRKYQMLSQYNAFAF